MNEMKVAHFHFGKDGGAERFFVHLVNSLHDHGAEQVSIIRRDRIWRKEIENSTSIIESNFRSVSLDRILLPLRLTNIINTWEPDALFAWMPKACRLLPKNSNRIRIGRLGDYPTKLSEFKNVDVLVCNTPGIVEHVKNMGWTRGVEMISNFTYAKSEKPVSRSELQTPEDAFLVSSMGRFVARKGFDVLINAMQIHKTMFLWLVGDGEENDNLRNQARELGVEDRIRFVGWQKNPMSYVAASDVFAAASSHEPLGNVILEAWAQNVSVVSTRSEGPSWFMTDENDGLLVDIADHEGFADAFTRLENDRAFGKKLVKGAQQTLQTTFSRKAVTNAYLDLFSRKP